MPQSVSVRKETRELPMLTLRAAFEPATFDEEKRTIELVWTTGAKGLRHSYWEGDYYEELEVSESAVRLDRLNNGAPLLAVHAAWSLDSVIGVVERAWLKDGKGYALVRLSDREEIRGVVGDIKAGILRNVSVGYRVYRYEIVKDADSKIDTYRAVDWEPMEISIVPIGFDDGSKTRNAEARDKFPVEIITRGGTATENKNKEGRVMDEEQKRAAEIEAAKELAKREAAEAATRAERARVTEIRSAVTKAGLDSDFADKLINDGVSVDEARAMIIDAMAERQQKDQRPTRGQHFEPGEQERDKWLRGAGEAIIIRAGLPHLFGDEGKKMTGDGFRSMRLLELARDFLERQGVSTRNMDPMRLVGEAFTYRSAYNGTSDFSVLLENVMHKVLLGAFATQPDVWRKFCAVGSVSDFRQHNRYRLGSFGALDSLDEHGEFKNKQIPDGAKEKISIGTKGNIIALSRQAIINDDLGAFNGLATAFGRAAALSIEVDVFAFLAMNGGLGGKLSDGQPIFHNRAGRNNIGTGSALSVAGLDSDRQVMASIKDISGNHYLDLRPAVLLVPVSLGGEARVINEAQYDLDGVSGATSANKFMKPNKVRGLFREIVDSPRLSGTRRYLFADPNIAPVIEVAFLDGQQTPFLDNQTGWRIDGVEWKVRLDYGVGGVGCEGAVTNAGSGG
jgi:hypothetical protein